MATILGAQEATTTWHQALAAATGGRVFTTHGCQWAWQPARKRLVLLFPQRAADAGLRPGLAEGVRLGAREVHAWLNAAADDGALRAAGFSDTAPVLWHAGRLSASEGAWPGRVRLGADVPEATGADALELRVATHWRTAGPGGNRPTRLGLAPGGQASSASAQPGSAPAVGGLRAEHVGAGHPSQRRIEHAVARTPDGRIVGRGFVQHTFGGDVALHALAVGRDHRMQGVGRALARSLVGALDHPAAPWAPGGGAGGAEILAAAPPRSAGFLVALGLQPMGRGRHLVLRPRGTARGR